MVSGSDQERHARTRRAVPMRLEAMPSNGTATCPGVTPAPRAARRSQPRSEAGNASTGKSGSSPRLSSSSAQSGSSQVPVSAFRPLACCSSVGSLLSAPCCRKGQKGQKGGCHHLLMRVRGPVGPGAALSCQLQFRSRWFSSWRDDRARVNTCLHRRRRAAHQITVFSSTQPRAIILPRRKAMALSVSLRLPVGAALSSATAPSSAAAA